MGLGTGNSKSILWRYSFLLHTRRALEWVDEAFEQGDMHQIGLAAVLHEALDGWTVMHGIWD